MRLQIAFDMVSIEEALEMAEKIHDIIDIVEIGTPMIIKYGMQPVKRMKERFPQLTVLADTKIADGGEIEARYAVEAGADIVTVLAVAADNTITGAKNVVHKAGKELYVDLLSTPDIIQRSKELETMGVDYIGVHTAVDVQQSGTTPFNDLKKLSETVSHTRIAAAGGITLDTLSLAMISHPDVIIAGGGLTNAPDLRAAVLAFQNKMADR